MKKKIIILLVMTLLIATAIPVTGIIIDVKFDESYTSDNTDIKSISNYKPKSPPFWWLNGADQKLTSNCRYGDEIFPPLIGAQEFKPTEDKLTAVALSFFKHDAPSGVEISVSIRDDLKGSDLATKTLDADKVNIKSRETWVLFDFPDVTVTPENTYYIVCSINGGMENESYLWFFDINNAYNRGMAWFSGDSGETWFDLEDLPWAPDFPQIDFCFITYFQEPPKSKLIDIPFILQKILQRFPFFEKILNQII